VRPSLATWLLVLAVGSAGAQTIPSDADWQESEAPPPPAMKLEGLVPIDMGNTAELRWGVDPDSIAVGKDGIVRYVVVGQSASGSVNGYYEGVRCKTAEVRVYARHAREGEWVPAQGSWMPLHGSSVARHSLAIAREGACIGHAPNGSRSQIARDLAESADYRFRNEVR